MQQNICCISYVAVLLIALSLPPCLSDVTVKALDISLPDPSPSSSSNAPALPCHTVVSLVATVARLISTSRGSGSWQTPSLFSLSHDSVSEKDPGVPSLLSADRRGFFSDAGGSR
ncbi:hypothetical protein GW17_00051357 [Ensete ventricosum]|nr:hypothetical protein GW17_00051357 [Ensete ventricosum]